MKPTPIRFIDENADFLETVLHVTSQYEEFTPSCALVSDLCVFDFVSGDVLEPKHLYKGQKIIFVEELMCMFSGADLYDMWLSDGMDPNGVEIYGTSDDVQFYVLKQVDRCEIHTFLKQYADLLYRIENEECVFQT